MSDKNKGIKILQAEDIIKSVLDELGDTADQSEATKNVDGDYYATMDEDDLKKANAMLMGDDYYEGDQKNLKKKVSSQQKNENEHFQDLLNQAATPVPEKKRPSKPVTSEKSTQSAVSETKPPTSIVLEDDLSRPLTIPTQSPEAAQPKYNPPTMVIDANEASFLKPIPSIPESAEPTASFVSPQSYDAMAFKASSLKTVQKRIIELEKEYERLVIDNERLSAALKVAQSKNQELIDSQHQQERRFKHTEDQYEARITILSDNLNRKENEKSTADQKISELELRLSSDVKKIRVREKELENRLELAKLEKNALVKAKDDTILELKRKQDKLEQDIETHQARVRDINDRMSRQQEQLSKTLRALRIALTHLEMNDNGQVVNGVPFKKAE